MLHNKGIVCDAIIRDILLLVNNHKLQAPSVSIYKN